MAGETVKTGVGRPPKTRAQQIARAVGEDGEKLGVEDRLAMLASFAADLDRRETRLRDGEATLAQERAATADEWARVEKARAALVSWEGRARVEIGDDGAVAIHIERIDLPPSAVEPPAEKAA